MRIIASRLFSTLRTCPAALVASRIPAPTTARNFSILRKMASENGIANASGAPGTAAMNTTSANNHLISRKRPNGQSKRQMKKQKKNKRERNMTEGSTEEVLYADIQALISSLKVSDEGTPAAATETTESTTPTLPKEGTEIDVKVLDISSTGDGLAIHEPTASPSAPHLFVVPFVAKGDVVRVKVFRHLPQENYSATDFISVTTPGPLRDDSLVKCPYFSSCSGCQFQMIPYEEQLAHKRLIVEKAYKNFSQLPPELIPIVGDTIGSPLQYGYRTKLTPHFDGPPGYRPSRRGAPRVPFESCPDIGFMQKGRRKVLDIEDCPIGTDAVRKGLVRERARIATDFATYSRGATILLRESTQRFPKGSADIPDTVPEDAVRAESESHVDVKTCVTDNNATTTEHIDDWIFTNPAGSFFQNNNSILPRFTAYIRDHILPPTPSPESKPIKYLIDAYSGSGLFTITLSPLFTSSIGIDIADKSIAYARKNASLNALAEERCSFIAADAGELFASVTSPPDETVVVLDPPRKGCDADFLSQLMRFGPKRVVYVSCNVHTQARDVGALVRGLEGAGEGKGAGARYSVESLVGFDFFPQTGHVEGVAVLNRVDEQEDKPMEG